MSKVMDYAPFGRLRYGCEHGVEYWRGSIALPSFELPFLLIVRASQAGPSRRQTAAMTDLLVNAVAVKREATGPMADLHRKNSQTLTAADSSDADVWEHLQPAEIDVSDDAYFGDGRIAILLIFGSKLEPSFAPAIETADGAFQQALTGT